MSRLLFVGLTFGGFFWMLWKMASLIPNVQ